MVARAVLAVRRGLRVRARRTPRPLRQARRCRAMVLMVALVVRAVMVAMVVPGARVARRPTVVPTGWQVTSALLPMVLPAVRAVPVVPGLTLRA